MKKLLLTLSIVTLFVLPFSVSADATYFCSGSSLSQLTVGDPQGADASRVSAYIQGCVNAGGTPNGPPSNTLPTPQKNSEPYYDPMTGLCITNCPAGVAPTQSNSTPSPTQSATANTPANKTGGNITYIPLEPLCTTGNCPTSYGANGAGFAQYVSSAYRLLVVLGSLLAVVLLTIGGVRYMTGFSEGQLDSAKKQMRAALWGLLVVVGSYLILYTLNPDLLKFNLNPANSTVTQASPANPFATPLTSYQQSVNKLQSDINAIGTMSDSERRNTFNKQNCTSINNQNSDIYTSAGNINCPLKSTYTAQSSNQDQCKALQVQLRDTQYKLDQCQANGITF